MAESKQIGIATIGPSQLTAINRVQWLTVAWMCVEVVVALFATIRTNSVALAAFGADSAIELLSAATVLWRFRSDRRHAEITATRITAWLLVTYRDAECAANKLRSVPIWINANQYRNGGHGR